MAHLARLQRRDATRLTRREPTVQLRTNPELRIRPQFKLPDWLLLASCSFEGLFFPDMPCMKRVYRDKQALFHCSAARNKAHFSSR